MRHLAASVVAFALSGAVLAQNQGLVLQNGTLDYVDVPFAPTLVPSGGVTAEAWITYDGSTLGPGWRFPTVFRMDPSPNQASFFLRVEAGQTRANRLLWWVSTTNGDYSISWTFTAGALQAWTHVAGTYDGSALRIFVDGVQVAQGVGTGTIRNRGGVFRIGCGDLTVSGGETWNGEIDEVRVWPFARSAAAIASARLASLALMPGEVSSWRLDGDALDSSGTNHGAAVGAPTFAANTLVLQPVAFPGATNFGAATGCRTDALAAMTAVPSIGNAGFGIVGTRAPANAAGLSLLSLAALPAPLSVLGIDLLVDVNAGVSSFVQANALGTREVAFALPNNPTFAGAAVAAQFGWIDPSCPTGLSASNALAVIVLP